MWQQFSQMKTQISGVREKERNYGPQNLALGRRDYNWYTTLINSSKSKPWTLDKNQIKNEHGMEAMKRKPLTTSLSSPPKKKNYKLVFKIIHQHKMGKYWSFWNASRDKTSWAKGSKSQTENGWLFILWSSQTKSGHLPTRGSTWLILGYLHCP